MKKLLTVTSLLTTLTLSLNADTLDECEVAYKAGNLDRAETLCTKATKEDAKSFWANLRLYHTYQGKGEYKKMLPIAQKLEKLAKTPQEYVIAYNQQGVAYGYLGDKKQELTYSIKALETNKKLGDKEAIGISLHNLGAYYLDNNNSNEAQKYFTEALEYKTNKASIASTYDSLATLYADKGNTQKAIEYAQKAMQYAKDGGNFVKYAHYSVGLASQYIKQQDYVNAKLLLDSALQMAKDRGVRNIEAYALNWLGVLSAKQDNYTDARSYFRQALEIATAIGDANAITDIKASLNKLK